jgi:1,4-alpha-glucan branching enzyme
MPGDRWQRFATLRALYGFMWSHPGKKLVFMGAELGVTREWDHDGSISWGLRGDPLHAGMERLVRDLNTTLRTLPALWEADVDPAGFRWIDANDSDQSIASYLRWDRDGARCVACVLNATPVVRHNYRIGVPFAGVWREVLNTDGEAYGGSNVGNLGAATATPVASHGFAHSLVVTLPPLGVVWFASPAPTD